MSKHTPGPWTVEDPMDFELSIVEANKETYEWRFIASIPLNDDDDADIPRATAEANAQLIAAAPDLLEAAQAMLEALGYFGAQDSPLDRVRVKMKAAIAKAEGQS